MEILSKVGNVAEGYSTCQHSEKSLKTKVCVNVDFYRQLKPQFTGTVQKTSEKVHKTPKMNSPLKIKGVLKYRLCGGPVAFSLPEGGSHPCKYGNL